jgi:hypothetical protein
MGKIKKYQTGGDTTTRKYPSGMITPSKKEMKSIPKYNPRKIERKDRQATKEEIRNLEKNKPAMPASQKNIGRKGIKVKAKNGKSFPDLNKDGKITKADILKGRGVIKNGGKMKKARGGATLSPSKKSTSNRLSSYGRVIGKNMSKMRMGGSMKKCRGGCY